MGLKIGQTLFSSLSRQVVLLAALALFQGLLYLILLPPWQHYDEPSHFEYAWLIANRTFRPTAEDIDGMMRREVASSMINHDFFRGLTPPDIQQADGTKISIGVSQLGKRPPYYALASLPLFLLRDVDVTIQLYAARVVSLILFVGTILVIYGMMRDLFPPAHPFRWLIPLTVALVPPFVDVMTAVNSDVGAVTAFSVFLWGMIRTIRWGFNLRRVFWIVGSVVACALVKETSAIAVVIAPVGVAIALWAQRGWKWRGFVAGCLALSVATIVAVFGWGDAQAWYRFRGWDAPSPTRTTNADAVLGQHMITLQAAQGPTHQLLNVIPEAEVEKLAGETISVGGWLWAERPSTQVELGLVWAARGSPRLDILASPIELSDVPTFYAHSYKIPEDAVKLYYALIARRPSAGDQPSLVYLDGSIVMQGEQDTRTPPVFSDDDASSGTWNGQTFVNLIRNASGESAWPRLRPWVAVLLPRLVNAERLLVMATLFDWARVAPVAFQTTTQSVLYGLFARFAWGHIELPGFIFPWLFQIWAIVALVGSVFWWLRGKALPKLRPALAFLAVAGLVGWLNVSLWPVTYILFARLPLTHSRYMFPVIVPTILVLVGGWLALWPRRMHRVAVTLLLVTMALLNILAITTIWSYYYLPA